MMNENLSEQLALTSEKDDLFGQQSWPDPFVFNEAVAAVFDDMVSRSVPLYRETVACAAQWACDYYQLDTHIIDIGCSTGTFFDLVGRVLSEPASLIGIDSAQPMLDRAEVKLAHLTDRHHLSLWHKDILDCTFDNSSVVVMNYTLQFLPVADRSTVLQAIYDGLRPGGLLFLSEKVKSISRRVQDTVTQQYQSFKTQNGYARTEIERKKAALENVLVPLTQEAQIEMLKQIGFSQVDTVLKMHNFVSFVAIK
ncbi:MAG: carboxy-S-adenosyl-L-methionine synthase CmoA [Chloroflexota bacterium]